MGKVRNRTQPATRSCRLLGRLIGRSEIGTAEDLADEEECFCGDFSLCAAWARQAREAIHVVSATRREGNGQQEHQCLRERNLEAAHARGIESCFGWKDTVGL